MSGPTLLNCDSATPPSPAMPDPSPKASASVRPVGTPMHEAMRRFWVTARTCRPRRVRTSRNATTASTAIEKPTIAMRFQGSTSVEVISSPPDIHDGLDNSTFWAPNSVRAACDSSSDTPKVASSVSSARPYRNRITVRSITSPTSPALMKATGIAATTYQSTHCGNQARKKPWVK